MWRKQLKQIPFLNRVGAAYRAAEIDRTARRNLARYEREARARGIKPLDGDALRDAVAQRLATTGRRVTPKPKGDLHVFLPFALFNWERILPISLQPFGEVTAFNWRDHGFDDAAPPDQWVTVRDDMNRRMLQEFHRAHARRPVDVVCGYFSGYSVSPETVQEMTRAGAVVLNFCYDDKVSFPGRVVGGRHLSNAPLAHVVDLNLTSVPSSVIKYFVHGGLAMFWPEAAHPDFHRPYDLPFEFDVAFPGSCFGWRPTFVRRLQELGVRVEAFGRGWPNGPLSDEDLVKLYSRARINLGSGGIGHSRNTLCLKGRDFEVPMSGGLYLTSHNPELALCFDLGREILTYRDEEDCARIIRHLLAHPDQAAAIRAAGRQRALRDHTYEVRWTQALEMVGLLR